MGVAGNAARPDVPHAEPIPETAAFEVIDLESGRVVRGQRAEWLGRPALPGSLNKVITLVAARRAGLVTSTTRIACRRTLQVEGRTLECAHPIVAGGLTPIEALAQSCNTFFVTLSRQLRREQWSAAALLLGLSPASGGASMALTSVGLDGPRVEPRAWVRAMQRAADDELVREGLERAASHGTASAFGARGIAALAKTGTAPAPRGGTNGFAVALVPAVAPRVGIVVVAPGAAGRDAAEIAARVAPPAPDGRVVKLGRAEQGKYRVDLVPLDEYVAGVLAAELPPEAHTALAQAMAIVARTYAVGQRERHGAEGFDLCDLTHCQAVARATPESRAAALATGDQVLRYGSAVAPVYYTASCGGHLERARDLWPAVTGEVPWFESRPDPASHPEDRWAATLDVRQVEAALQSGGLRGGPLRDVRILARTASGRVSAVGLDGMRPARIGGEAFRLLVGRHLGWQHLQSTWFDVSRTASGHRFDGRGKGHGVGLCVRGAAVLAQGGATPAGILAVYFPGTSIGTLPSPAAPRTDADAEGGGRGVSGATALRVVLPVESEPTRRDLDRRARALLDFVAALTGGRPPGTLTLRFHPTVESYQRATGQPWWTSASTQGDRVELLPLDVLARRGTLDVTLAHELVHVVTQEMFEQEPRWVREGAAVFFAARVSGKPSPPPAPATTSACPSDVDFSRVRNGDALARLYAAAGDCFSRWWAARTPASRTSSHPRLSTR
jgi:stage II sporulation protein D